MSENNKETDKKDYDSYEEKILDIDEVIGTDIKINPDFYIHTALLKAQAAMMKDNLKEGFIQYRQFIEHIEVLCDAANMLPTDYQEQVTAFKNTEEFKSITDTLIQSVKLANKKLSLIMTSVFSRKISKDPLKA